jgi:hypothetical protein
MENLENDFITDFSSLGITAGEGWRKPVSDVQLYACTHFISKAETVKTDNFCDPVAALCNCQASIFDVNGIGRR